MVDAVNMTLCYMIKDQQWLMLFRNKKENDINQNKWIGIGGKVEVNETIEEGAIREIKEETGLNPHHLDFKGTVDFQYEDCSSEMIYVYTCHDFSGELKDCDEGTLAWVDEDKILDLDLWEGDILFLKDILENKDEPFAYQLIYDAKGKLISSIDVREKKDE